ncbi:RND family transporter [Bacteriovorax sp. Seq25_V]|uniref:efflux RND transporter permease subunit n=1 Tax=Bacteriovorax sp. Seq25_V TaxID=1201288 RepID=UPI00038A026A|nr:MMPL family transporter [Bacteriovorax sp. Seq25_V]EQC47738.1 MMPL family protein [Bacteriovorax sp. Seq25_V]
MNKLINFICLKPKLTVLISLFCVLLSIPGLMSAKTNFSYRVWFQEDDPLLHQIDLFEKEFGSSESTVIVVTNEDGIFNKETLEYIRTLTLKAGLLPHSAKAESLTSHNWVDSTDDEINISPMLDIDVEVNAQTIAQLKERANDQDIMMRFIGPTKKVALIYVKVRALPGEEIHSKQTVGELNGLLESNPPPKGITIKLTGNSVITSVFKDSAVDDLKVLFPLLLAIMICFIFFQFRSIKIVALSMFTIILTIITMMSFCGYLEIPIHNLTAIAPEFIMAIGLADAIHIVSTFYLFNKAGIKSDVTMSKALKKNFLPTIITTLTTMFGFFSFMSADIKNINDLGAIAGIGTVVAWFYTYLFLAPMIILFFKNQKNSKLKEVSFPIDYKKFVNHLITYKHVVYFSFAVFSIFSVYMATQLDVNSDPLKYFSEKYHVASDLEYVENNVGGIFSLEMTVDTGVENGVKNHEFLKRIDAFSEKLRSEFPDITKTVSVVDIVKRMNQVLHANKLEYRKLPDTNEEISQYLFLYNLSIPEGESLNDKLNIEGSKLRLSALMKNQDSKSTMKMIREINVLAKDFDLNLAVTGKRYLWQSINEKVVHSFIISLSMALVIISVILSIFLKSITIGIVGLIPNLIPVLATGLILKLTGRPLDIGSAVIASIVLGIAVDDSIHIASNFLRIRGEGKNAKDSLIELFEKTAPSLIITTLILSVSFSSFILAGFVPNQNLGLLMSLGLMVALLTDLFLFPVILYDLTKNKDK